MYYSGQYFIILIPLMIFSFFAQAKVSGTFNKYLRVASARNMTGAETARMILDRNGLRDVRVEMVGGKLSDHYDPRTKIISLSADVYESTSLASISVAAHECGHAIQHSVEYVPLSVRSAMAPVANIGSKASWFLLIAGFALGLGGLIDIGIILFSAAVLFQIVTLPVEFNASSRAIVQMKDLGILQEDEVSGAKKVLSAAAMTYVAAAAMALGQLIRLILIRNSRD